MKKVEDSHDSTEIAEKRDRIANEISEDEIFVHAVYKALKVPNANIIEKLILAFSTIPETRSNFSLAKDRFITIADLLEANGEVTSEEIMLFKQSIKDINSLQELLLRRNSIAN